MGSAFVGALEALCCKDSQFGWFWQMWCLCCVAAVYRLVSVCVIVVCRESVFWYITH